jgi:hypothetical protein
MEVQPNLRVQQTQVLRLIVLLGLLIEELKLMNFWQIAEPMHVLDLI